MLLHIFRKAVEIKQTLIMPQRKGAYKTQGLWLAASVFEKGRIEFIKY